MRIHKKGPTDSLLWVYMRWYWDQQQLVEDSCEAMTHQQLIEALPHVEQCCTAPGWNSAKVPFHKTFSSRSQEPSDIFDVNQDERPAFSGIVPRPHEPVRQWSQQGP